MNILIACDKFKGSLTAVECCRTIAKAIGSLSGDPKIRCFPMADGGEGSMDVFLQETRGTEKKTRSTDPLGRPVKAGYGISQDNRKVFIEVASTSGLPLLKVSERNPMMTSSKGTGELLLQALNEPGEEITVGVGGTATTDGGAGMATALGFKFLDSDGKLVDPVGGNLRYIHTIEPPVAPFSVKKPLVLAACDVTNPLFGEVGAALCYSMQKGASMNDAKMLDEGLQNLNEVVKGSLGKELAFIPGAGAGGGLGYGLMVFAGAQIVSGFEWLSALVRLEEQIQNADLIITGEGKIDMQTMHGKVVAGVCRLAKSYAKPVIAYAGEITDRETVFKELKLQGIYGLRDSGVSLKESISEAERLLTRLVKQSILQHLY